MKKITTLILATLIAAMTGCTSTQENVVGSLAVSTSVETVSTVTAAMTKITKKQPEPAS